MHALSETRCVVADVEQVSGRVRAGEVSGVKGLGTSLVTVLSLRNI